MRSRGWGFVALLTCAVLFSGWACSLLSAVSPPKEDFQVPPTSAPAAVLPSATAAVVHMTIPAAAAGAGQFVYDTVSEDTASEGRAPYGDSYNLNRLERPFRQDMSYLPYIDIVTFAVEGDATWWYVTIRLVGQHADSDPPFHYGVEIDRDHDGFGDFLIIAQTPITTQWETSGVRIFADQNHDTGGVSPETSDAPLSSNGYESLVYNGGSGDADPDLAWVRTVTGDRPSVQFAFKKSWSGTQFMLGVIADAGQQDPGRLDYVDHFTLAEAGSPVRDNPNFPLKALFAFDNCCREAYGFEATGYEPQLCPRPEPTATRKPKPPTEVPPPAGCPDPGNCPENSYWVGEPGCYCSPY